MLQRVDLSVFKEYRGRVQSVFTILVLETLPLAGPGVAPCKNHVPAPGVQRWPKLTEINLCSDLNELLYQELA